MIERGRVEEARSALLPLLREEPAHAGAGLEMGRILLAAGDAAGAAAAVGSALTNQLTARQATLLLAQIRMLQGDAAGRSSAAAAR